MNKDGKKGHDNAATANEKEGKERKVKKMKETEKEHSNKGVNSKDGHEQKTTKKTSETTIIALKYTFIVKSNEIKLFKTRMR